MKRIVETLLEEGILEEDIHRILDLIEEEYEIVSEGGNLRNVVNRAVINAIDYKNGDYTPKSQKYGKHLYKVYARGPHYENNVADKALKYPSEKDDLYKPNGYYGKDIIEKPNENPIKKQTNINKKRDNKKQRTYHEPTYSSVPDQFIDNDD